MRSFPVLVLILFVMLIFAIGGHATYVYLVQKPPKFLIEFLTKTKPPPPLPPGDKAPLTTPEGFVATIYSRDVPGARVMTRDQNGKMLVSLTAGGKVVMLTDHGEGTVADTPITLLEGLKQPHGILVRCATASTTAASGTSTQNSGSECILYVAETDALKSYAYDSDAHKAVYLSTLTTFPTGAGHFTRTLLMHPDDKRMLISIGSDCNVCNETDPKRASIQTYDLETGKEATYAKGLRNSVFMAVRPQTDEIWATENGRDVIGDNIPPDEINIIKEGKYYGWPFCYGNNIHDTDFDNKKYTLDPCTGFEPAHIDLAAHVAPLGLAFIPQNGWPKEYANDLLIAYHGSWNRSIPSGYKVVRYDLDEEGRINNSQPFDFVTGFLAPGGSTGDSLGRPVGLLAEPNGVLYVSDDRAGAIYRISLVRNKS